MDKLSIACLVCSYLMALAAGIQLSNRNYAWFLADSIICIANIVAAYHS